MSDHNSTQLDQRPPLPVVNAQLSEFGGQHSLDEHLHLFPDSFDEAEQFAEGVKVEMIRQHLTEQAFVTAIAAVTIQDSWGNALRHGRVASQRANRPHFDVAMHPPYQLRGDVLGRKRSQIEQIISDLGRLEAGWAGDESVAPRSSVLKDIQTVSTCFPRKIANPEVEIDPEDGSVVLRWASLGFGETFSLTFPGDGSVIGYLSLNQGSAPAWQAKATDLRKLAVKLADEKIAELMAG